MTEHTMAQKINGITHAQKMKSYRRDPLSLALLFIVNLSSLLTIAILAFIIGFILVRGIPNLSYKLFELEYTTENVSLFPALVNTLIVVAMALIIAVPLGIFSAVYLTEYAKKGSRLVKVIRITAETLSGIPSIIYGLFGMLFFVIALKMGYSILAGALTLAIMILPLIMRTTEEALLAVPISYREGSYGLGAGKMRTVFRIVLPSAMPGILAGIILGIGRIVGETAALIYTAGSIAAIPKTLKSSGRTLAVHMYALSTEGIYVNEAYATAVVLIVVVVIINWLSTISARKLTKG